MILPLLIHTRQYLGWNYIYKRLLSEKIIYEESGWYDGQIWEKPIEWREKELLIAQHEVKPIINEIIKALFLTLVLVSIGTIIYNIVV